MSLRGTLRACTSRPAPRQASWSGWSAGDLRRRGSPAYDVGRVAARRRGGEQLFVPLLRQGYCTLEPRTVVVYKCDAYYAAEAESGVLFSDPVIGIDWPIPATA